MSPMAVSSSPLPFLSSSSSFTCHLRRAGTATATAASSASEDFDYPLADPSVRWPHLRFPHLPAPRFPATVTAAPPVPARPPPQEVEDPAATSASASAPSLVEPLDARAHRGRVKKLSKLALRRVQDWRACGRARGRRPRAASRGARRRRARRRSGNAGRGRLRRARRRGELLAARAGCLRVARPEHRPGFTRRRRRPWRPRPRAPGFDRGGGLPPLRWRGRHCSGVQCHDGRLCTLLPIR